MAAPPPMSMTLVTNGLVTADLAMEVAMSRRNRLHTVKDRSQAALGGPAAMDRLRTVLRAVTRRRKLTAKMEDACHEETMRSHVWPWRWTSNQGPNMSMHETLNLGGLRNFVDGADLMFCNGGPRSAVKTSADADGTAAQLAAPARRTRASRSITDRPRGAPPGRGTWSWLEVVVMR